MRILVTGGAGFIGSALVRYLVNELSFEVLNIDKLTYAGNLESLTSVASNKKYRFLKADICDKSTMEASFADFQPEIVMHLAAESHVDRSIEGAGEFVATNIVGTFTLLEAARNYWGKLPEPQRKAFRFHHISTDEVYGDLEVGDELFTEQTPYQPSSPYSATKAGSDHLVRAWHRTYGFPSMITNCSNNYGPYHFPEKLVPLMILNALEGKHLPVYGEGQQIRDWLYVEDHVQALYTVVTEGRVGRTYNIGGHNEVKNIDVVNNICDLLEELAPKNSPKYLYDSHSRESGNLNGYKSLITHVPDRPGHDARYAINTYRIENELSWKPQETFETGLRKTVQWYLDNLEWAKRVQDGSYQRERLGLGGR